MIGLIVALLVIMVLLGMVTVGGISATISSWLPILAIVALVVVVIRAISGRHAY
jgi:hypothetical protein